MVEILEKEMTCCRKCREDIEVDENEICEQCDKELDRQADIRTENERIERRFDVRDY